MLSQRLLESAIHVQDQTKLSEPTTDRYDPIKTEENLKAKLLKTAYEVIQQLDALPFHEGASYKNQIIASLQRLNHHDALDTLYDIASQLKPMLGQQQQQEIYQKFELLLDLKATSVAEVLIQDIQEYKNFMAQ